MEKVIIRLATAEDISQIIDLQIKHHVQNVPREQKEKNGFVTLLTTSSILLECIGLRLIFVAIDESIAEDNIIGYIIMMRPFTANKIEFLKPLIEEISERASGMTEYSRTLLKDWRNYLILAQVLVLPVYAGKKIGTQLFSNAERRAKEFSVHYILTEVSSANPSSIKFHYSLGFVNSHSYNTAGQNFIIIRKKM